MRRRRIIFAVAAFAILLSATVSVAFVELNRSPGSGSITTQWLNRQLINWKPSSNGSLIFGATALRSSYGIKSYNTMQVQAADIKMLLSSNVSAIRIDIGYGPWLTNNTAIIRAITSAVNLVKSSGKALIIADASSETYRSGGQLNWTDFKQQWIQRVRTLASLYHPYAYIVVKEPGWYFPMISDALTNPLVHSPYDWSNLTVSLINAVKSVSPQTIAGVSVAAYDLYNSSYYQGKVSFEVRYLQLVEKIPSLDFIGFDIYGL